MKTFILSRTTATALQHELGSSSKKMRTVVAPIDFKKRNGHFLVTSSSRQSGGDDSEIISYVCPETRKAFRIPNPRDLLEAAKRNNSAFRIYRRDKSGVVADQDLEEEKRQNEDMMLSFEPLEISSFPSSSPPSSTSSSPKNKKNHHHVFKLCEPLETNVVGPVLEIDGMKMHISSRFASTTDFSSLLAQAASASTIASKAIRDGSYRCLDFFFGQGYSSLRC